MPGAESRSRPGGWLLQGHSSTQAGRTQKPAAQSVVPRVLPLSWTGTSLGCRKAKTTPTQLERHARGPAGSAALKAAPEDSTLKGKGHQTWSEASLRPLPQVWTSHKLSPGLCFLICNRGSVIRPVFFDVGSLRLQGSSDELPGEALVFFRPPVSLHLGKENRSVPLTKDNKRTMRF